MSRPGDRAIVAVTTRISRELEGLEGLDPPREFTRARLRPRTSIILVPPRCQRAQRERRQLWSMAARFFDLALW